MMTEDRLDVCRTVVLFLARQTPSFIGVKEVRHSPIHPIAGKRLSRKLKVLENYIVRHEALGDGTTKDPDVL